ncbi:MAG: sce7726 family protein [Bacillota bacterium]|nr:sce7726 family protein [Bacillota bacterium]
MTANNMILNHLFTQRVIYSLMHARSNEVYGSAVQRYIRDPANTDNSTLLREIYRHMAKEHRNEYFYLNTLFNKLLCGKHSISTTTALTQIPIHRSKADLILINGQAVVYEIKTELDTFNRLDTQLCDYFRAFSHVCVVTSESQYGRAAHILAETPVGIYVLTQQNTLSSTLRKEPRADTSKLEHTAIFKVLRKQEYERILLRYYSSLPVASPAFYYGECLKQFSGIPILEAYDLAIRQLKQRNRIALSDFMRVPFELKSLIYFSRPSKSDLQAINVF